MVSEQRSKGMEKRDFALASLPPVPTSLEVDDMQIAKATAGARQGFAGFVPVAPVMPAVTSEHAIALHALHDMSNVCRNMATNLPSLLQGIQQAFEDKMKKLIEEEVKKVTDMWLFETEANVLVLEERVTATESNLTHLQKLFQEKLEAENEALKTYAVTRQKMYTSISDVNMRMNAYTEQLFETVHTMQDEICALRKNYVNMKRRACGIADGVETPCKKTKLSSDEVFTAPTEQAAESHQIPKIPDIIHVLKEILKDMGVSAWMARKKLVSTHRVLEKLRTVCGVSTSKQELVKVLHSSAFQDSLRTMCGEMKVSVDDLAVCL